MILQNKIDPKLRIAPAMLPFHRGGLNGPRVMLVVKGANEELTRRLAFALLERASRSEYNKLV